MPLNSLDQHPESFYYSHDSTVSQTPALSQTINYHPTQSHVSRSMDNPFVDLSLTVPTRTTASSRTAPRDPQSVLRSTSNAVLSSIFGPDPFSETNSQLGQRSTASQPPPPPPPLPPPEPSSRRNYVNSTTAARSLEGDDRPIFGGSGGSTAAGRGRSRFPTVAPIREQQSLNNSLRRNNTFVLDQPSLPNLPQSSAQKSRDKVIVQELYNVRRQNRVQAPVAFTINLNEDSQLPGAEATNNSIG